MGVHVRHRLLDGAQDVAVVPRVQAARQAALHAHLGGAHFPRFDGPLGDFLERQVVGVGRPRRGAEGAEGAADEADVGEVDVAVDHVGDDVTRDLPAQVIRHRRQRLDVVAGQRGQHEALVARQLVAGHGAFQHARHLGGGLRQQVRHARLGFLHVCSDFHGIGTPFRSSIG